MEQLNYLSPLFDVAVIGSGPAGCAAAITCVQHGLTTVLISDLSTVRKKGAPSESIHPGVITLLTTLKADASLNLSSRGTYEGIEIENSVSLFPMENDSLLLGHHLDRETFDSSLLDASKSQGVIHISGKVSKLLLQDNAIIGFVLEEGQSFITKYVIDGTGRKRFSGKKLGFLEKFYSPPLFSWTGTSTNIETNHYLFKSKNTKFIPEVNGWTWIAPEQLGNCSWTRLSIKGQKNYMPPKCLHAYPISGSIKTNNVRWRLFRPLYKEGIILCGDAAGVLDPAAGQGILNALYSGLIAGQTAHKCISNPDMENKYLSEYDFWYSELYEEKVVMLKKHYEQLGINIFQN